MRPFMLPIFFYGGQIARALELAPGMHASSQKVALTEIRALLVWLLLQLGIVRREEAQALLAFTPLPRPATLDHRARRATGVDEVAALLRGLLALQARAPDDGARHARWEVAQRLRSSLDKLCDTLLVEARVGGGGARWWANGRACRCGCCCYRHRCQQAQPAFSCCTQPPSACPHPPHPPTPAGLPALPQAVVTEWPRPPTQHLPSHPLQAVVAEYPRPPTNAGDVNPGRQMHGRAIGLTRAVGELKSRLLADEFRWGAFVEEEGGLHGLYAEAEDSASKRSVAKVGGRSAGLGASLAS